MAFLVIALYGLFVGCTPHPKTEIPVVQLSTLDINNAIDWLGQVPSLRTLDNSHLPRPAKEPDYKAWLARGRDIPAIGQALTKILADRDQRIDLAHVVFAIRWLGNKNSIPVLLETLKDEDIYLRVESARALGEVGDDTVISPLSEAATTDASDNVRGNAVLALGNFKSKQAMSCLNAALGDESEFVRRLAAKAIRQHKSK